nr:MAG TPA: hypothetical protein [Caudoviricetes sp.]
MRHFELLFKSLILKCFKSNYILLYSIYIPFEFNFK